MNSIFESLSQIAYNKGVSEREIVNIVKEMLLAAYQRTYGTDINAVIEISEDYNDIKIFSRKRIVEKVSDSLLEISLFEALKIKEDAKLEDNIFIQLSLDKLGRNAIYAARKVVHSKINEINRNRLYTQFLEKKGYIVTGKILREKRGNYYIDLGSIEGILTYRDRLKNSEYYIGQQLRVLIKDLTIYREELQIYVSRIDPLFVQRLFEIEIPEIEEKKITIEAIVRDPGYKTKIAVSSKEVEPVGTCIGVKGVRIGVILKELEGEQIDVVQYSSDIREYIQNNFSRIKIVKIFIESEEEKKVLIAVDSADLSLIIGQKGRNIRLTSKLIGWNLSVKSTEEVKDLLLEDNYKKVVERFFSNDEYIGEHLIDELKDLKLETIQTLKSYGLNTLEKIVQLSKEDLLNFPNLTEEEVDQIIFLIESTVVLVEEDEEGNYQEQDQNIDKNQVEEASGDSYELEEDYEYYCPECNNVIEYGDKECKSCGVEIVFE